AATRGPAARVIPRVAGRPRGVVRRGNPAWTTDTGVYPGLLWPSVLFCPPIGWFGQDACPRGAGVCLRRHPPVASRRHGDRGNDSPPRGPARLGHAEGERGLASLHPLRRPPVLA